MYVKPSAPHSIGGVLDDAFRLYRDSFAKAWPVALCGRLVSSIPIVILQFQFAGANSRDPQAVLAMFKSPATWLPYLVAALVTLGFYNSLVVLINGVATGTVQTAGRSLSAGFRLLPRSILLILTMVLAGGLVAGAMGVSLGLFNRLGSPAVRATLLLAFALVLIYVWGRAFLSNVALVVEDAGVFASLRISWGLIKHHWWRATTVYTVAIIIVLVFYVVIGVVDGIIGATLHNSLALAVVLGQVVAVLGGSVLMTFVPAVLISMYYDLKLRKEGADLAVRVNALTPQ